MVFNFCLHVLDDGAMLLEVPMTAVHSIYINLSIFLPVILLHTTYDLPVLPVHLLLNHVFSILLHMLVTHD